MRSSTVNPLALERGIKTVKVLVCAQLHPCSLGQCVEELYITRNRDASGYEISIPEKDFVEEKVIASRGGNCHAWDETFTWFDGWSIEKIGGIDKIPTQTAAYYPKIKKTIEFFQNGSLHHATYASFDGENWGCISRYSRSNLYASIGNRWEAAVEGEDEYSECVAQSWYGSMREAIEANPMDWEEEMVFRMPADDRIEDGELSETYSRFFEVGGYSSPTGEPFYRLRAEYRPKPKILSVKNNCPVPRGGMFEEIISYSDGRTKTIRISCFQGKYSDWDSFVEKQPFDDEK